MENLFNKLKQHFKNIDLEQFKKDSEEINKELEGTPEVCVDDLLEAFKEHLENVDRDEFLAFWDEEEKLFKNKKSNNHIMTQEEILIYNKRCAEFLGFKKDTVNGKDVVRIPNKTWSEWSNRGQDYVEDDWYALYKPSFHSLKYHSDWNWIMEVVEAILKLPNIKKQEDTTQQSKRIAIQAYLGRANKEAVVSAINQFLIWYKQNK
jgi:hypothetical protein